MLYEYKERSTDYGDGMDTTTNVGAKGSPSSSNLPQYPTLNAFHSYGIIPNIIRLEHLLFLATQYLI